MGVYVCMFVCGRGGGRLCGRGCVSVECSIFRLIYVTRESFSRVQVFELLYMAGWGRGNSILQVRGCVNERM